MREILKKILKKIRKDLNILRISKNFGKVYKMNFRKL